MVAWVASTKSWSAHAYEKMSYSVCLSDKRVSSVSPVQASTTADVSFAAHLRQEKTRLRNHCPDLCCCGISHVLLLSCAVLRVYTSLEKRCIPNWRLAQQWPVLLLSCAAAIWCPFSNYGVQIHWLCFQAQQPSDAHSPITKCKYIDDAVVRSSHQVLF